MTVPRRNDSSSSLFHLLSSSLASASNKKRPRDPKRRQRQHKTTTAAPNTTTTTMPQQATTEMMNRKSPASEQDTPVTTAGSSFSSSLESSTLLEFPLPHEDDDRLHHPSASLRRFSSSNSSTDSSAATPRLLFYPAPTPRSPPTTAALRTTQQINQLQQRHQSNGCAPCSSPVTHTTVASSSSFALSSPGTASPRPRVSVHPRHPSTPRPEPTNSNNNSNNRPSTPRPEHNHNNNSLLLHHQQQQPQQQHYQGISLVGLSKSWEMLAGEEEEEEEEEIEFELDHEHSNSINNSKVVPKQQDKVVLASAAPRHNKNNSNDDCNDEESEYDEITVESHELLLLEQQQQQRQQQPHGVEIAFDQRETLVDDDSELSSIHSVYSDGEFLEVEISFEEEEVVDSSSCFGPALPSLRQQQWLRDAQEVNAVPSRKDFELEEEEEGSLPKHLFLPSLKKDLFYETKEERQEDDVCSDTMSTTHDSSICEELPVELVHKLEKDAISVTSCRSDPPLEIPEPVARTQHDFTHFRTGLSPKKTPYPSEPKLTLSPVRDAEVENAKKLPVAQLVKNNLPEQKEKYPVVSLSFLANPLTPTTVHRMMEQSWNMLEPGGTIYVCHVVQRRQDMTNGADGGGLKPSSSFDVSPDDIVPNTDTVACLEPFIPKHMKEHICLVDGPGCVKFRKLEIETLQILQNQPHKRGITSFSPQHDLIQRWKGVKPLDG